MSPIPHPGSVAFRLLNELEGLVDGIRADGIINAAEFARVERWLVENEPFSNIRPFSELADKLRRALADRVLTVDECDDLLFVCQKLTTVNPHFDQLRAGIQVLMGLLSGVSADSVLRPEELARLENWADEWEHLRGYWPFDECQSLVTSIVLHQRGVSAAHLFELANQFPVAGQVHIETGELLPLLVGGVCAVDPDIVFANRAFAFTGESEKCSREEFGALVVDRGGIHHQNIRKDTNYLIVCDGGSPAWAFSCYGRKVEKALEYRKVGQPLVLAQERDFWDVLPDVSPRAAASTPNRTGNPTHSNTESCDQ